MGMNGTFYSKWLGMAYSMELNDKFLEHFIWTYYGSGNYAGNYWFIGMEEGGGTTFKRVQKRLETWQTLGEEELVDLYDFHAGINYLDYFKDPVKLQHTWMQQARIILASKGLPSTREQIRTYQRNIIGRKNSESCLLELLPLPSPNTSTWHYNQWSTLSYLKDRKAYREYCIPRRIDHIQTQIKIHLPKVVVFFSTSYTPYWQQIAGKAVSFQDKEGFSLGKSASTTFVICKHPAARGIPNAYFEKIGLYLRNSS